jgi:hypothetical protein
MAKKVFGYCKLCGDYKKLSKEHVPPSKAFNSGEYKLETINRYKTKDILEWQQTKKHGGHYSYVFCEQCNNLTGSWYVKEYIKLAKICAPYAHPDNAGRIISIQTSGFYPLRVFKQAISIICATSETDANSNWSFIGSPTFSGPRPIKSDADISLAVEYLQQLKKFVLDKSAHVLPVPVRLYTYLVCNFKGRTTGIVKSWNFSTGQVSLFAEFSWSPLGWALVFEGEVEPDLFDVTGWSKYEYDEGLPLTLRLPVVWVESNAPLDFKSPAQMDLLRAINQAVIDARPNQRQG